MAANKESWKNTVNNWKTREEVDNQSTDYMRSLACKLVKECFFKDEFDGKPRGMWQKSKPDGWPADLPFQDPNNRSSNGKKPGRVHLKSLLLFLVKRYKTQNQQEFEDGNGNQAQPGPSGAGPKVARAASDASRSESEGASSPEPPVVTRLRGWLQAPTSNQPRYNDIKVTLTTALCSHDGAANKRLLKLLHNIEYFLELDPSKIDQDDERRFDEDLANLKNEMHQLEDMEEGPGNLESKMGARKRKRDSDDDDKESRLRRSPRPIPVTVQRYEAM